LARTGGISETGPVTGNFPGTSFGAQARAILAEFHRLPTKGRVLNQLVCGIPSGPKVPAISIGPIIGSSLGFLGAGDQKSRPEARTLGYLGPPKTEIFYSGSRGPKNTRAAR